MSEDDIKELVEYLSHQHWRCEYRLRYKRCLCGLDDLCTRLGIPIVQVYDPETKCATS